MTNITEDHKNAFDALINGDPNFALFSCFVDQNPTTAICHIKEIQSGVFHILPLFVAVTDNMSLTDHDGVSTQ